MKSFASRIAPILALMALPMIVEPLSLRIGALLICAGLAMALASRWFRGTGQTANDGGPGEGSGPSTAEPAYGKLLEDMHSRGEMVHRMSKQIQDVVQHTEEAAMEINSRVITIIGRARKQMQAMNDIVAGLATTHGVRDDSREQGLRSTIEAMEQETGLLADDVNGVIRSLQFQDLTKQRLDDVISQLQQLRSELEMFPVCPAAVPAGARQRKRHPVS
jgi:hypothetical protein